MVLLLAFILVPIAEIALLIHVGGLIGTWETIGLVILTAVVGTALLRAQGFLVLNRAQNVLAEGGFPAEELFDGVCILIAGVLLLTPGFLTDGLGLALLVPGLRGLIGRALWRAVQHSGRFEMHTSRTVYEDYRRSDDDIIEGDYHDVTPNRPQAGDRIEPADRDPRRR